MPNQKILVKKIFYNVCMGGVWIRRVTLKKKAKRKETNPPQRYF